ncbi:hypothetical protein LINPERHAP1_LOCUS24065 [Linum perenne]
MMAKSVSDHYITPNTSTSTTTTSPNTPKKTHKKHHKYTSMALLRKLSIGLITISAAIFLLLHLQSSPPSSWFTSQCDHDHDLMNSMTQKLKASVTFLPLKDLRYSNNPLQGHTWFMSSTHDYQDQPGGVQYQHFPSPNSQHRHLCFQGRDNHDGSWNYYALAWRQSLPVNATFLPGLTFISYNHYNYDNIWHGLSALVPFVAWHISNNCGAPPDRWLLYHWGEMRLGMGTWLTALTEATFGGGPPKVEGFEGVFKMGDHRHDVAVCFEKAVVMRHNEGGMSREKRMETYDLIRCKARAYCNVSLAGRGADVDEKGSPVIGMTVFMRSGARSFRNESEVIRVFGKECGKVDGCRLLVAHSNNLTFCEQVKVMSSTDILISAHGAQLTNLFLMDRNSSVMEFFPKGWLKLAGVGQLVYRWMASWSGMNHSGTWRDPDGAHCPFPEDDRRCMTIFKDGTIGVNETHFSLWARTVLGEVKLRKLEESKFNRRNVKESPTTCPCGS